MMSPWLQQYDQSLEGDLVMVGPVARKVIGPSGITLGWYKWLCGL